MKIINLEPMASGRNGARSFLPSSKPTGRYLMAEETRRRPEAQGTGEFSLSIQFKPEVKFEAPLRVREEPIDPVSVGLERLKKAELQRRHAALCVPFKRQLIQSALNEAESIAWASSFPLLVFPELAKEKALWATEYIRRQEEIWRRDRLPITLAA
jgi:hypothetical protein